MLAAAPERFNEIYVSADLETCEDAIRKVFIKKRAPVKFKFTGIDSPYEPPTNPEMVVDTQNNDVKTCVEQVRALC